MIRTNQNRPNLQISRSKYTNTYKLFKHVEKDSTNDMKNEMNNNMIKRKKNKKKKRV